MPDLEPPHLEPPPPTDNRSTPAPDGPDPLAHLHKMSTTAGLGSTDYVAINGTSVAAVILGLASSLAVLDNILLIIPVAGVICAAVALYQIAQSGGTQAGRALAIMGLLLSLGFAAYVGYASFSRTQQEKRDQAVIEGLIDQFTEHVKKGEFDQAYALFSDRFQQRIDTQRFADTMRYVQSHPQWGDLQDITTSGRYDFMSDPTTNLRIGQAMLLMKLDKFEDPSRQEAVFRVVEGQWKFENIPGLFPEPQQQPQ